MDENLKLIRLLVWELLNFMSGGSPDINIRRAQKSEVEQMEHMAPKKFKEFLHKSNKTNKKRL